MSQHSEPLCSASWKLARGGSLHPSSCPSLQAAPSWVIQLLQRNLGKELHPSVGMGHWMGSIAASSMPETRTEGRWNQLVGQGDTWTQTHVCHPGTNGSGGNPLSKGWPFGAPAPSPKLPPCPGMSPRFPRLGSRHCGRWQAAHPTLCGCLCKR